MRICLIGFGEVGRVYAEALVTAGEVVGVICDHHVNPTGRDLATRIGAIVESMPGPWLADYDIIMSAVPGRVALEVATACSSFLRAGALYVDLSTASPDDIQAADECVRGRGGRFVDVGILGAISVRKGATALVAAGEVEDFAKIAQKLGATLKVLPGKPGDAVRLKLLRSVFTKGLEALAVETLVAAERQELREAFFDIVTDLDDMPLQQLLEVLVTTHVVHAPRRHHEVQEAARQLRNIGMDSLVTNGVGEFFNRSASAERIDLTRETPTIGDALDHMMPICCRPKPDREPDSQIAQSRLDGL